MCELFAMSSRSPTRVSLSLELLAARGAPGGSLADGWGVACYDGRDVRLMRDPEPAGDSPWLKGALAAGRPNSRTVIAHIRHATQGGLSLANTQPFARELDGRIHVFAHNGMLLGVERLFGQSPPRSARSGKRIPRSHSAPFSTASRHCGMTNPRRSQSDMPKSGASRKNYARSVQRTSSIATAKSCSRTAIAVSKLTAQSLGPACIS
jgi:predicted glutamine amidotransferase